MFSFIKNKLQKIFNQFTSQLSTIFGKKHIDKNTLKELEILLLSSDVGVKTTQTIIQNLEKRMHHNALSTGTELKNVLNEMLTTILNNTPTYQEKSTIFLFVGINGSGKTTSIGKFAHLYASQGKKVLLIAADTFRAAATEQLVEWAQTTNTDIVRGKEGQDPSSLIFQGCEQFKKNAYDILIIDTAGRLQTKINLMNELAKIKRTVSKQLPDHTITTFLTIDGMLGQNSFEQAKLFKESTDVNGIILTKMDGSGKGGIVFAIAQSLSIPISYITFGEQIDHLKKFNTQEYVNELLG